MSLNSRGAVAEASRLNLGFPNQADASSRMDAGTPTLLHFYHL